MARRRGHRAATTPQWGRRKMLFLVTGAATAVTVTATAVMVSVTRPDDPTAGVDSTSLSGSPGVAVNGQDDDSTRPTAAAIQDALAARPMPSVPESDSRPGPVSTADPGESIVLPPATVVGPAGVPTGFPQTPEGALAQLAAIDQTAVQAASLDGAREVIESWALPGGPTAGSWSVVHAVGDLLDAAGLSGGGSAQLAVVLTPLMGLIKGTVGPDFVVPCVDFELDVTLQQTARGAVADCQRMVWRTDRWLIGPGAEPAVPPSVWPDTDVAISVGYRDLRRG